MAVRPLLPALLLSATALLAGCADSFDGKTITVQQDAAVEGAMGPDGATGDCDGDGNLAYTLTRRAGTIRIYVTDAEGGLAHDSGELDAAPDGFAGDSTTPLAGPAGTWSVSVDRSNFTGSYTVTVAC